MGSDPEIDAAFAASASPTSVNSGDDEIDAAFSKPSWSTAAKGAGKMFLGGAEGAAHMATGAIGSLGGGLTYLGTLGLTGDPDAAKAVQEDTQRALTYEPRTKEGK